MLRARRVSRDERQADIGLHHTGKLYLRLLGGFLKSLHSHLVAAQVYAVVGLERVYHPSDYSVVEIVAAEAVVARGGKDFYDAVAYFKYRDVERTAAEVVYYDLLLGVVLVNAVCERRRCRLVDYTENIKSRNLAGVLRRLSLSVREVRRDGDDRLSYGRSEVSLGVVLHFLQDHSGNFLRRVGFAVYRYLMSGTHFTLYGHNRSVRVCYRLSFCRRADYSFTGFGESHDRRGRSHSLGIRDDRGLAALIYRDTRVCRT